MRDVRYGNTRKKNNYGDFAEHLIGKYYGKYCGIYNDIGVHNGLNIQKNFFTLITPNIPGYVAELYGEQFRVDYHLAGFSMLPRNSFVRAEGEAVERYSHMMAEAKLRKQIIYTSANALRSAGYKVCPLEYVNVYTKQQLEDIKLSNFSRNYIKDDDKIEWICCKSIFDDSQIYIPAQMFFLLSSNSLEKRFFMSVSTGTASHKSKEKAMLNALIEYLQVDSMMMNWYVLGKMKKIEGSEVVNCLIEKTGCDKEYDVEFFDMSLDKPLYVIGCIVKNKKKKYPYCAYGMQADSSLEKAMYRSFMEAYANIGPRLNVRGEKHSIDFERVSERVERNTIYNLNDNTDFYLSEQGINLVDEWLKKVVEDSNSSIEKKNIKEGDLLDEIIKYLSGMSKYACYLDITSSEFDKDEWCVVRTVIPELLPLCMPSVPYKNHPRVKMYGGVRNECIHPCP